jgi:hypothetical protein
VLYLERPCIRVHNHPLVVGRFRTSDLKEAALGLWELYVAEWGFFDRDFAG